MSDPFDLERFVTAQAPCLEAVERELRAGHKQTHWMWFVFPQLQGLGSSPTARKYALSSLAEATAYATHPLLDPRLREHTRLVIAANRPVAAIFGSPDDMKFHSCVTLFARTPDAAVFHEALSKCFDGKPDSKTLRLLAQ